MILRNNENELYLLGTIWDGDGMRFLSEFNRLEKQFDTIRIKMHLYGGSVFDGNLICNALETSKSEIFLDVIGLACSMGGVIVLSVKPENVSIVDNGYIMTHAPQSGSYGEAKDHESQAVLLRMIEKNFIKKLMVRLNLTEADAKTYIEKDNWVDADKALKLGFVGSINPSLVDTILQIVAPEEYGETEVYNMFSNILLNPEAIGLPVNSKQIFNDNMKKLLISAFALALTEQSSDTAFIEAIQEKLAAEKTEKDSAEAALKTYKDAQITAMVDAADLEESEKETYKNIGASSGVEALAMVLKSKSKPADDKPLNIGAMLQNGGGSTTVTTARADWDFKKWQSEDPKGLEKMSETEPEKFAGLFNANYK